MESKGSYSNKPLIQRILFLLTGIFNFLIGFTLYYLLKDDKSKEWQVEFLQRGSMLGLAFTIIGICAYIVSKIF